MTTPDSLSAAAASVSTAHLDYLVRHGEDLDPKPVDSRWTTAPPSLRRMWRINSVGRPDKLERVERLQAGAHRPFRMPGEELAAGLYGYLLPMAYLLRGDGSGVEVEIGTWSPAERESASHTVLEGRQQILMSVLRGLYPIIEAKPSSQVWPELPLAGMAMGIPATRPTDVSDTAAPIDRLIRAMRGASWAHLVIAEPVDLAFVIGLRRDVINEMRIALTAQQSQLAPSPLAQHYVDLLHRLLASLTTGMSTGMWRTAVYLLGNDESFPRLVAAWRSIFAGEESLPEPIRISHGFKSSDADGNGSWRMSDAPEQVGPGRFRYPFQYQTLLHSGQLGALVQFPEEETPGFGVRTVPQFDTVPREVEGPRLRLGRVIQNGISLDSLYEVPLRDLTRHVLVAGITGSGKTNTIMHLLREAVKSGLPFLVVEPAKSEYRSLLDHPEIGQQMRVFTLGDELTSPFRLNPFQVPEGVTVAQHLDLLRAVFASSFGMWTPLPQVLERCLHGVYVDRGWNLTTNHNRRLDPGSDSDLSFPTLSDLVAKVAEVVPQLGYEQRIADDISAALTTRLESLRTGGKGRMLDTQKSASIGELLQHPTILELEPMGDDDDKAFLMALLLVRLVEHRRAEGTSNALRHLLVIEEAHRLLAAVPQRNSEEQADPRGKAVETFTNVLSEIRAYGQGVVIADQVPVRLAPDATKNTALKIAHRTVAADDREALAGSMAMDHRQARSLTTMAPGTAAVFGDGDDLPLLVDVPMVARPNQPQNASVAARMAKLHEPQVKELCCPASGTPACDTARRLTTDPVMQRTFARIVMSTIEEPGALDRLWPDLLGAVRARRGPDIDESVLLRSLAHHQSAWLGQRRGSQAVWTYSATQQFVDQLIRALVEKLDDGGVTAARHAFRQLAYRQFVRSFDPYDACSVICDQATPPVCLYRHWMADLVGAGTYHERWVEAELASAAAPDRNRVATWDASQDAGYTAIEFPELDWSDDLREAVTSGARRACLCFAQQMLAMDALVVPRSSRRIMKRILQAAGIGPADQNTKPPPQANTATSSDSLQSVERVAT